MSNSLLTLPNKALIQVSLDELENHLKDGIKSIRHSDQGWQYQIPDYQQRLRDVRQYPKHVSKGKLP